MVTARLVLTALCWSDNRGAACSPDRLKYGELPQKIKGAC